MKIKLLYFMNLFILFGFILISGTIKSMEQEIILKNQYRAGDTIGQVVINSITNNTDKIIRLQTEDQATTITLYPSQEYSSPLFVGNIVLDESPGMGKNYFLTTSTNSGQTNEYSLYVAALARSKGQQVIGRVEIMHTPTYKWITRGEFNEFVKITNQRLLMLYIDLAFAGNNLKETDIRITPELVKPGKEEID